MATRQVTGWSDTDEERDLVGIYLHEISRAALLDAETEVELSKAIEAGLFAKHLLGSGRIFDETRRRKLERLVEEGKMAKDQFIRANLRLVVSIARRYVRSGMPMLDLIQEGNTGLVRAVEKFDYTRGYKFSTYATWWIRQAISRALSQQERTIRVPVHYAEEINRMRSVVRQFVREHGCEPNLVQIAALVGASEGYVLELIRWSQQPVSLQTSVGEGEATLGDVLRDENDPGFEGYVLDREHVAGLLAQLDERSARVLRLRFGLEDGIEYTIAEVAVKLSKSREWTRQLEVRALEKLRALTCNVQMA